MSAVSHSAPRCWLAVVSRSHVARAVAGGFGQASHGKAAPMRRMRPGDWLVFYSPTESLGGGAPCRRFTAIGRVADGDVYEADMGGGFVPSRRHVSFVAGAREAEIGPLRGALSFVPAGPNWGLPFRRGHFEIPGDDLRRIAAAMGVAVTDGRPLETTGA
ncbi:MAG: EVE domain-containing protein [Gemmatirosa sp.]|nr:EVE domain-containing protein [Gemmatirosa sp.]